MSFRSIHLSLQGPGTGGQDDHGDSSCVVCMDRPVAVRSRPCNHAVTCELCVIKGLIEQRKPLNCFACCYCCDKVTELVWLPVRGSRGEFRHIQMPTFASGSEAGAQAFRSIRSFVYAMLDHTEPEVVMAAREALLRAERLHEHTPSRRRTRAHRRHAYAADEHGTVVVPEGTTSINSCAHLSSTSLRAIAFPSSLTSIGSNAFEDCTSLFRVCLNPSLASIGDRAFANCTALVSISLSANLETIGNRAFACCSSLTTIYLPASLMSIGTGAFFCCTALSTITLPAKLKTIGNRAFAGCTSLVQVNLPPTVESIEDHAFLCCTSLTTISLSTSLISIGNRSFAGCISLTALVIPNRLKFIDDHAFLCCSSLTTMKLPPSLLCLGEFAFDRCTSLSHVRVPRNLQVPASAMPNLIVIRRPPSLRDTMGWLYSRVAHARSGLRLTATGY